MKTLFHLQDIAVVLVTCLRVKSAERTKDLYYYDVRHEDECQMSPCTVEKSVRVNHLGTIATLKPLLLTDGILELNEQEAASLSHEL